MSEKLALMQETISTALRSIACYMDDPNVTEIMVTGDGTAFVERGGEIVTTDIHIPEHDREIALKAIARLVGLEALVGTPSAIVTASLGGFRFAGALMPIDPRGSTICIRKHTDPSKRPSMERLVEMGMLNTWQANLLEDLIIKQCKNALFIGKTSSGKTTLLNAVLSKLPLSERVGLIEDAKELAILVPNRNEYLTNPTDGVYAADLIKLAMRERYDRLVLGESRGNETFDLVRALSSGHDGSASTMHGSSAKRGLSALEMMYQMSIPPGAQITSDTARSFIAECVHLLVYCERRYEEQADGTLKSIRQVKEIVTVDGVENGEYKLTYK